MTFPNPVPILAAGLLAVSAGPLAPGGRPFAPVLQERGPQDPVQRLGQWVERFRRFGPDKMIKEFEVAQELAADLRMLQIAEPDRRREVLLVLLDLAGARRERRGAREVPYRPDAETRRVRALGLEVLGPILAADGDGSLAGWIATGVLPFASVHPLERRLAALRVLEGLHRPETRLGLFTCAVDEDPELREAAMRALTGWQDDGVHEFMIHQLERAQGQPGWLPPRLVQRHFAGLTLPPESEGSQALLEYVRGGMLATDWRRAIRALEMSGALANEVAVPGLIEALAVWMGRRELGQGSRRLENELVEDLQERSGRSIGAHPQRWATWWKAVSSGQVEQGPPGEGTESTRAGFFGLRPVTDRVTFVIDRSGSMTTPFGLDGKSRYQEAVDQMMGFLTDMGESTRFRVILFDSDTRLWKKRLQLATRVNLSAVERWLRYNHPDGGTMLYPAIERIFARDRHGKPDLEQIEEDTVIVLCDGATNEGAGWVGPLLREANQEALLVFHCAQIGSGGDGTLEQLAEQSGGDFVRILE